MSSTELEETQAPTATLTSVAVVGASGHVARHLVAALTRDGIDVCPVDREPAAAPAVDHAVAVVHLAGTLKPLGRNTYRDANVGTVKRTLAAAQQSGVQRLVFVSYVGANPESRNEYLRTKGEAEAHHQRPSQRTAARYLCPRRTARPVCRRTRRAAQPTAGEGPASRAAACDSDRHGYAIADASNGRRPLGRLASRRATRVEAARCRATLNFFAQLAALWVFVAYKLSGRRDRLTEISASVAVVVVTATVLLVYAL